jgi:Flp pilus assembly protein TadG
MTRRTPRRGFWKDEEGAVTALVLVFMGALLGIFATMKSLSMRYTTLTQMQTGADAAALAAARTLADPPDTPAPAGAADPATLVRTSARQYAELNMEPARFDRAVEDKDIVIGNWNPATGTFTPNLAPLNAVRVVTQQSTANGNQHRDFLPAIVGAPAGIDLRREAIAYATTSFAPCILNGFAAMGTITAGSNNLLNGFCLHADDDEEDDDDSSSDSDSGSDDGIAIDIGNNNAFEPGARVGLGPDAGRFKLGNNTRNPPAAQQQELDIIAASDISARLAEFRTSTAVNNKLPSLPWVTGGTLSWSFPRARDGKVELTNRDRSGEAALIANRVYIVNGNVEIGRDFSGFAVYATGTITIESNTRLQNVFLAAGQDIEIGSNVEIGAVRWENKPNTPPVPTDCEAISGAVFMMAGRDVDLGSRIGLSGAQVIAGRNFVAGSNNMLYGVSVQTVGNVDINANNRLLGCGGMAERMLQEPLDPVVSVRLVR